MQCCTHLEVLTLSRCTSSILYRRGLSVIDQVSSDRFRELNISILSHESYIDSLLDEIRPQLSTIDTQLQQPSFVNLERFNIGLPVVNNLQEFLPLTAARDLLRVVDIGEMDKLPAITNGQGGL